MTISSQRINELDGLRGIAASMVVFTHLVNFRVIDGWDYPFGLAAAGVDIFFALSGFLIGGILFDHYADPVLMRVSYARRFLRIVPIYLLLVASFAIARAVEANCHVGLEPVLVTSKTLPIGRYLLFLQSNFMAVERSAFPTWMVVTWSVGVEEQFYLIAPVLVRLFHPKRVIWICLTLIVCCPAVRYWYLIKQGNLLATGLLTARSDCLAWGVLIAWLIRDPRWAARLERHKRLVSYVAISAFALYAMRLTLPLPQIPWIIPPGYDQTFWDGLSHSCYAFVTALLILHVRSAARSPLSVILRFRPFREAGRISYSVYLFHLPVLFVASLYIAEPVLGWVVIGATIALCTASWFFLEAPLIRYGKRTFAYSESERPWER